MRLNHSNSWEEFLTLSIRSNVLTIDCAAICKNARSETKLVSVSSRCLPVWVTS